MTRFEQEYLGLLGEYWEKEAMKELAKVRTKLENGEITINENGVARNCIGRVVMRDMLEKLTYVTDKVNEVATTQAREEEVAKTIESYRANYKEPNEEELFEMRNAFGEGEVVVDILTGRTIQL